MNVTTTRAVESVVEKFPELWNEDKTLFDMTVQETYEADIADYFDYQFHLRALRWYDFFAPCHFESVDGGRHLKSNPYVTQKGYYLAEIARRLMLKAAKSDSDLRLDDYTDFAERIVNPQAALF